MKIKTVAFGISKICLLGILTGCAAGLEKPDADIYAPGAFNDNNLDVLFPARFPVPT